MAIDIESWWISLDSFEESLTLFIFCYYFFLFLDTSNLLVYLSEGNHGSNENSRNPRDEWHWQNIRYKRIYTFLAKRNAGAEKHGYVIRLRHGRDFARDRRERSIEKYETTDIERKRMFNHVECAARGDASPSTRHRLYAFRAQTPRTRENTATFGTHAHTLPWNNSISRKNLYIGKNFERSKIPNRNIQIDVDMETNIKVNSGIETETSKNPER